MDSVTRCDAIYLYRQREWGSRPCLSIRRCASEDDALTAVIRHVFFFGEKALETGPSLQAKMQEGRFFRPTSETGHRKGLNGEWLLRQAQKGSAGSFSP